MVLLINFKSKKTMKKTAFILSILILFQSCYSYKTFDIKDYETIENGKIKVETKDNRTLKGEIIEIKNDTIIIENSKKTLKKL